ncbi:hypothetical protein D3C83_66510 [compost metagenome]
MAARILDDHTENIIIPVCNEFVDIADDDRNTKRLATRAKNIDRLREYILSNK